MSEADPTPDEIAYLATLTTMRCDGFDRTAPELARRILKLQAFKDYVHRRLDEAGVPTDPPSTHRENGCRIGGRLDWIIGRRATIRAWQVCPEDIVAAATWEEACAFHVREMGSDREDLGDDPEECDLATTMRREAEDASSERITLAHAIAECTSFPCLLCSTEY